MANVSGKKKKQYKDFSNLHKTFWSTMVVVLSSVYFEFPFVFPGIVVYPHGNATHTAILGQDNATC